MNANKKFKASVFSLLFGNAETLRELYEAITGVKIPPDVPISINTLEDVLFMEQINDLSFSIGDKIVVLIEHQSTINPNMPLRLLMYIARVYEKITGSENIYSSRQVAIPRVEFIVLYNGAALYPDEAVLKLSDLYADKSFAPELELTVKVYNINTGHNEARLRKSEKLGGYSAFIDKVREFEAQTSNLDQALKEAVNWCIEHGILPDFLKANGSEVVNMLLTEWNMDKALEVRGKEAWEDGRMEGRTEGRAEGRTEGRAEGEARKQKEFIDLLQSGKRPEEILKQYGYK
jgi:predicted transposase YdaD